MELDRIGKRGEDVPYSGNEDNKDHHTKRVAIKLSKKANSSLVEWKSVNKKRRGYELKLNATIYKIVQESNKQSP